MRSLADRERTESVGGMSTSSKVESIHRQLTRALQQRDWSTVASLYHPDALLVTVAGGDSALNVEETMAAFRAASDELFYSTVVSRYETLDEAAVAVAGRMRRPRPDGGLTDNECVWLVTLEGGLIYRCGIYPSLGEARAAYEALGRGLGIARSEPGASPAPVAG